MEETEQKLHKELESLKKEHVALDEMIESLSGDAEFDQLRLQRYKKRKLSIKDRMAIIESILYPDIIA